MSDVPAIREAFRRNRAALALRPARGRGTAVTTVRSMAGLTCEVSEGPWRLTVDMGPRHGGGDAGPNPGVLGRGALGACLAIAWRVWAAHLGIALDEVAVDVEADYDAAGLLAEAGPRPGYSQVRCLVTVTSDAPAADLERLAALAAAHAPYVDVFSRPVDLRHDLRVNRRRPEVAQPPGRGSGSAAVAGCAPPP